MRLIPPLDHLVREHANGGQTDIALNALISFVSPLWPVLPRTPLRHASGKLSRRLRLVSFLADPPWVCCDALAPNPPDKALAPLQVGEDELGTDLSKGIGGIGRQSAQGFLDVVPGHREHYIIEARRIGDGRGRSSLPKLSDFCCERFRSPSAAQHHLNTLVRWPRAQTQGRLRRLRSFQSSLSFPIGEVEQHGTDLAWFGCKNLARKDMAKRHIRADQHGNLPTEHTFSSSAPFHRDRGSAPFQRLFPLQAANMQRQPSGPRMIVRS